MKIGSMDLFMRDVLVLVLLLSFSLVIGASSSRSRHKRSLIQLGLMIDCTERQHNFADYNGYGCWCGIGGTGTPLDATDQCCYTHDHCYDRLPRSAGGPCILHPQIYTALYERFHCNHCRGTSAYNHWWYKLLLASPQCRRALCQCDSALVRCLRRAESTFNPDYRYYYKRITACESLLPWIPMFPDGNVVLPQSPAQNSIHPHHYHHHHSDNNDHL